MQNDPGVVERLLAVRLTAALSGIDFVPPGRTPPTAEDAIWTSIARVSITPVPRQKGSSEVDRARVVVAMQVAAGQGAIMENAYELHSAMGAVAAALANQTFSDVVATVETHRLDLDGAQCDEDAEPFDSRLGKTGCVTVTGILERLA